MCFPHKQSNIFISVISESQQGFKSHRPSQEEAVRTGVSAPVNVSEHAAQSLQQERQGDDTLQLWLPLFLHSLFSSALLPHHPPPTAPCTLFFSIFHLFSSFYCFISSTISPRWSKIHSPWSVSYSHTQIFLYQYVALAVWYLTSVQAAWTRIHLNFEMVYLHRCRVSFSFFTLPLPRLIGDEVTPVFLCVCVQSYSFLISSDYERAEWREIIKEQQKKCKCPENVLSDGVWSRSEQLDSHVYKTS